MRTLRLRDCNNLLTVIVIGLALYILLWPFVPKATLIVQKHQAPFNGYRYKNRVQPNPGQATIPQDNRIVIPSLALDQPIAESSSIRVLDHGGTWRRPTSSTPDKGGNTVIIGHRFTYKGLSTFYNLDQLQPGAIILVYWHGHEYDYTVHESSVVSPQNSNVESPTTDSRLTLYTCTPLWTSKNRLVITALPLEAKI